MSNLRNDHVALNLGVKGHQAHSAISPKARSAVGQIIVAGHNNSVSAPRSVPTIPASRSCLPANHDNLGGIVPSRDINENWAENNDPAVVAILGPALVRGVSDRWRNQRRSPKRVCGELGDQPDQL